MIIEEWEGSRRRRLARVKGSMHGPAGVDPTNIDRPAEVVAALGFSHHHRAVAREGCKDDAVTPNPLAAAHGLVERRNRSCRRPRAQF